MIDAAHEPHEAGRNEFLKQVGHAVLEWQNVENALATLFAALFRPKDQGQWNALEAAMHTLMARGKIDAIAAAVSHVFSEDLTTRNDCEALLVKAKKFAARRNAVAHSTWMIEIASIIDTRDGSESFEIGENVVSPHPLGRKKGPGSPANEIEADAKAFSTFSRQVYALASRIDPRGQLLPPPLEHRS